MQPSQHQMTHAKIYPLKTHIPTQRITVESSGYFNQILVTSVAFLLCVCDTWSSRSAYNLNQCSWPFLLNQFRKLINQHFWWGFLFWSYTSNHNYVYTENGSKNRSQQIGDFNIPQKLFQCMQSCCKSQVPCFLTSHVHPQTTCWTKARPRHFLWNNFL